MVYEPKEFLLKDGKKVIFKSPEPRDAKLMIDNIVAVASSTDNLLSAPHDFDKYYADISLEERWIVSNREGPNYLIAVYLNGVIIGSCSLNMRPQEKAKHRATIGIAIQKQYWGKGIGSLLFDEMIQIGKGIGLEQIELHVIASNDRAKRLYAKKGFVKTGNLPHELKLKDGSYLDGETMVLFL